MRDTNGRDDSREDDGEGEPEDQRRGDDGYDDEHGWQRERCEDPDPRSSSVRRWGQAGAVPVGDGDDGHAVEHAGQAEGSDGQPTGADEVKVRIVRPQRVDPRRRDHQVQQPEDDAAEPSRRQEAPNKHIDRAAHEPGEDAAEDVQADRAVEFDASDHLVGLGNSALGVITCGHGQQAHDQPDGRTGHQRTRPETADKGDGDPAQVTQHSGSHQWGTLCVSP